ncbi:MAG: TRAP transporter small permease [Pseudomonadota bacterium]
MPKDDDHKLEIQYVSLRTWLRQPEILLAGIVLLSFIVLASLQVITRYVIGEPFVWTEELSSHLLIWLTYLGATGVHRSQGHIRVELLQDLVAPETYRWFQLVFDLLILACLLLLAYGGWQLFTGMRFEKLPALRWPLRNVLIVAPICSAIMAIYTIGHIISRFRQAAKPNPGLPA